MLRRKKGAIEWLEFELFAPFPELSASVFLRHGGVSEGVYGSLNAGSREDQKPHIEENRQRIMNVLGITRLHNCLQPHSDQVAFLPGDPSSYLNECDGMITNRFDEALLILHADCQAAIFFDPVTKTIACVHSGWRSQVKNIYRATVEKMQKCANCKPENLLVAVSPSLGPSRSEFINFRQEWPESFWQFQFKPNYFDLWAIGKHQLQEAGIQPQNIQFAEICTYDHPEDFFSYRRQKPAGGHATVACLKSSIFEK